MSHLMFMYTTVLYKCMKLVDIDSHNMSYNMYVSVLSGEATDTNFIVFGLTRSGIDPTVYHTLGEHAN